MSEIGIMKSFNMNGFELPQFLKEHTDLLKPFKLTYGQNCGFLNLEIGKKYYMIFQKEIMAFKVKKIIYHYRFTRKITFELLLANNKIFYLNNSEIYSKHNSIGYKIFETKEDLLEYRETANNELLYTNIILFSEFIEKYFENEFVTGCYEDCNLISYYKVGFYLNDDMVLCYTNALFKCLWVDSFGGHYQVYNKKQGYHNMNDVMLYPTEQDCLNSAKCYDFDDEETDDNEQECQITFVVKRKDAEYVSKILLKSGCLIR